MLTGRVVLVGAWFMLLAGVVLGINTGVQAETAADAEIEFNGTHLIHAEGAENVTELNDTNTSAQPAELRQFDREIERRTAWLPQLITDKQARTATREMLRVTFAVLAPVMDWFATFAYRHDNPAVVGALRLALYGSLFGSVAYVALPVYRLVVQR